MSHSILMPLINSPFALGGAQACAESFADADERAIAMAELAYFQGRPEDAAALSRPYLESPDVALRSSACFIFAYASLPLGQVAQTRYALDVLERQAQTASEGSRPAAIFARDAAFSLLHLDVPDALAANDLSQKSLMPRLGEGVKLFLSYVRAHQAYLAGDYAYSLGIAEGALGMATALRPIPALYLHLVCCMDAMSLKKVAYAKELFHRAWSLAAPDGLIQGLAEHHGLLGGLIETCIKPVDPVLYRRIIDITYRFSAGWRRVHNSRTGEDVADNLSTTEFSIAMLVNRGWSVREVADFLDISQNTVKTHLKGVYQKLGITSRKELASFMLR